MTQPPNAASTIRPRSFIAIVIVVALAALTTLHRLGAADVCGSNEAVEAVFLQQMVEHDALLFPLENGRSPMYKPPLFHWTAVAIDRLAGIRKVTAFNLRLPAALYAIAGIILTIAFTATILGPNGALLAGLILTASYQYLENARIGRVDMTLCFFETLTLFVFALLVMPKAKRANGSARRANIESSNIHAPGEVSRQAAARPRSLTPHFVQGEGERALGADEDSSTPSDRSFSSLRESSTNANSADRSPVEIRDCGDNYLRYLLAVALGLAVLAKGPVGAMLPGLAIAIFLAAERRWSDVRKLATLGPVLLTLAIASSWYLACLFGRRYGFLDRQIGSENFGRFFGALGAMAPWYYLKPILLNSVPLSLIVPFAVFSALRTYWRPAAIEGPSDVTNEAANKAANEAANEGADNPQHLAHDARGVLSQDDARRLSQDPSLSRERSSDVNEVHRPADEGSPASPNPTDAASASPDAGSRRHEPPASHRRPAQNPLSLWVALRMMFLPKMDAPRSRRSPISTSSTDLHDPQHLADDARRLSQDHVGGVISQHLSLSKERSPDVNEVHRQAGEVSQFPPADPQSSRALLAVRLFAIFWAVTVLFFTLAAYKRRAYLLPLWPTSAVILSWWLMRLARSRNSRFLRAAVAATCAVLIAINFYLLPHNEVRDCAGDSMRPAAAQINRVVGPAEPLYLFQFEDEPAPLLFYLDRTAPRIDGKLGDAPPGYVITTAETWHRLKPQALDLEPVFESSSGRPRLVLLRHGKAYAHR